MTLVLPGFRIAAVLVLLLAGGGCATTMGTRCPQTFNAAELPVAYQPQALADPNAVNIPTPAQAKSDVIGPDYLLEVSLAAGLDKDSSTTFHVRVAENGLASLPEIGSVQVAGRQEVEAERQIADAATQRGIYVRPTVTVRIEHRPTNSITVVGAVKNPGPHQVLRSASCLGTAIVEAGGFAEKAGTRIQIVRRVREPRVVVVDIGNERQQAVVPLDDGDVVTVEKRNLSPVQVVGLISKPVQVEYPVGRPFRLMNAIAEGGGESNDLADSITIQRQFSDGTPSGSGVVSIHASLAKAMDNGPENLLLAPGDVVRVDRTPATYFWDAIKRLMFSIGGTVPLVQ